MKETISTNIEARKITNEEALYFVEHLQGGQEIFNGKERLVFVKNSSNGEKVIMIDPDHLDKNGKPPKHTFLKEILVDIVKANPINIQDFGATVKKDDPELEEFRKSQRKAALLEKIEKEGLPFIETLSVNEIKDKDIAKKILEVKKRTKEKEELLKIKSKYGLTPITEIKKSAKKVTPKIEAKEAEESWSEKILKRVEEKRKKILETFTKKSGYYGKLVLRGALAFVASVGILHGELSRNTDIYTSANTAVEEPAPKQETAEEIVKRIEEQLNQNKQNQKDSINNSTRAERLAQIDFLSGVEAARKSSKIPKIEIQEEEPAEAPVFETVSPLEIKPTEEPKVEISNTVLQDFMNSIDKKDEPAPEIIPTPEPVYNIESTPTPVFEIAPEITPEPEQVKILETETVQPTIVEPAQETQKEPTETIPTPEPEITPMQSAIRHIFGNENSIEWLNIKDKKAKETLGEDSLFGNYLLKLKGFALLDPKRKGFLFKKETNEEFMFRCLKKLEENGDLKRFEGELRRTR